MKKIIFTLLAITLVSCSLEKRPDTAWGEDDYFKTEGQLKSLLNGGYVCMQKALGAGASIYGEMRADIYYCSRTSAVDFDNIINNNITSYNKYASWASFYQIIQQANLVIARADEMTKQGLIDSDTAKQLVGEAYAMRAFTYFWIVRIWGEAPLALVPSVGDKYDRRMKKSTVEDIFTQILIDIEQAKALLPDNGSRTHFTLSSIYALKAQVCTWMKDWAGVLQANSHFFEEDGVTFKNSGYSLAVLYDSKNSNSDNNYISNCEYAGIFNVGKSKESIFELSYAIEDNALSNSLFSVFDSVRPTGEVKTRYTKNKSIDWRCAVNFYGNSPKLTKYFIEFTDYNSETRNVVLLRLGEMVLLQAEAYVNLIPTGETAAERNAMKNKAIDLLNIIRARAGGDSYLINPSDYDSEDVDLLRILVADERYKELFGEGYRYFDLVRTGTLLEVMGPVNGQDDMLSAVWPIHYQEILYSNGAIEQNVFYK